MASGGNRQEASKLAQLGKENLDLTEMEMGQEIQPLLKSSPSGTKPSLVLSTPTKKQSGPLSSPSDRNLKLKNKSLNSSAKTLDER